MPGVPPPPLGLALIGALEEACVDEILDKNLLSAVHPIKFWELFGTFLVLLNPA